MCDWAEIASKTAAKTAAPEIRVDVRLVEGVQLEQVRLNEWRINVPPTIANPAEQARADTVAEGLAARRRSRLEQMLAEPGRAPEGPEVQALRAIIEKHTAPLPAEGAFSIRLDDQRLANLITYQELGPWPVNWSPVTVVAYQSRFYRIWTTHAAGTAALAAISEAVRVAAAGLVVLTPSPAVVSLAASLPAPSLNDEEAGTEEAGGGSDRRRRSGIPSAVKTQVWQRDQGRCVECGSRERLEFDHIIPWSQGGSDTYRNLQLLCEPCNRRKGATLG